MRGEVLFFVCKLIINWVESEMINELKNKNSGIMNNYVVIKELKLWMYYLLLYLWL